VGACYHPLGINNKQKLEQGDYLIIRAFPLDVVKEELPEFQFGRAYSNNAFNISSQIEPVEYIWDGDADVIFGSGEMDKISGNKQRVDILRKLINAIKYIR